MTEPVQPITLSSSSQLVYECNGLAGPGRRGPERANRLLSQPHAMRHICNYMQLCTITVHSYENGRRRAAEVTYDKKAA
jgi:hypothetical protein